jgi:hypothetical protein
LSGQCDPTGVAARACGRGLELGKADEGLTEAACRKARALSALGEADRLLGVARDEMQMLEGLYYCNLYAELGQQRGRLETLTAVSGGSRLRPESSNSD